MQLHELQRGKFYRVTYPELRVGDIVIGTDPGATGGRALILVSNNPIYKDDVGDLALNTIWEFEELNCVFEGVS